MRFNKQLNEIAAHSINEHPEADASVLLSVSEDIAHLLDTGGLTPDDILYHCENYAVRNKLDTKTFDALIDMGSIAYEDVLTSETYIKMLRAL